LPSIVYGGVKYKQLRHAIKCKKCLETIESKHSSDYKECPCKSLAIDGDISDGNRILGDISDIENRSIYLAIIQKRR
jgi:hypothetical protein